MIAVDKGDFFLYNTYLTKRAAQGYNFLWQKLSCILFGLSVAIRSNIWYSWDKGGNNLFFIYQRGYFI